MNSIDDIKKYRNFSMLTYPRLIHLRDVVQSFNNNKDVCYVQCGVAKGGALALIRDFSNKHTAIYGFDSFNHMPNLTENDENEDRALKHNFDKNGNKYIGKMFANESDVINTFKKLNTSFDNVKLIKGYIQDTFPNHINNINNIAVLHLDLDFYEATMYALENLYDKVIQNGVIIIDDYGAYKGCRNAVHDFRSKHNITSPIHRTIETEIKGLKDGTEAWWVKQ
jgi:O-methyltransferase